MHKDIERIEVNEKYFEVILNNKGTINKIKKLGFKFVTPDLVGLTSGSFDK